MHIYRHPLVAFRVNSVIQPYLHVSICKFIKSIRFQNVARIFQAIDSISAYPYSKTFKNAMYRCRPVGNFQPARHVLPRHFLAAFEHSCHYDSTGRSMCAYDLASTQSHTTQIAPVPFLEHTSTATSDPPPLRGWRHGRETPYMPQMTCGNRVRGDRGLAELLSSKVQPRRSEKCQNAPNGMPEKEIKKSNNLPSPYNQM